MDNTKLKLLHIEDDSTDAFLMEELLNEGLGSQNLSITHVDSLRDALKEFQTNVFDAVLLDLNLKDVRGTDNVSALVAQNSNVPVVVLTGVDNKDAVVRAINLGAQDYLVKGYCNSVVIRMAINSSIERKKQERELYQQANFDEVTGLPNSRLFLNLLKQSVIKAHQNRADQGLVFININKLHDISNKNGFEACKALAFELSNRIKKCFSADCIISRYNESEFVVITADKTFKHKSSASQFGSTLLRCLNEKFMYKNKNLDFSAKVHLSYFPLAKMDPETIADNIDSTLAKARNASGIMH